MFHALQIPPGELFALLAAIGFAAGLNVYATVAVLGLLAGGLELLQSWTVIAASSALFLVEFFADKVPAFDLIYNPGNRLHQIVFPSTLTETYQFDHNNNLQSTTDRNNNSITYYYDYQDHLYRKVYPDSNALTYTYDAAGRLKTVQDTLTGAYSFGYDNMNRLTSDGADYSFDSAGTLTVQYGYDKASNRNSMTDPQLVDLLPDFRTKLSMICAKERGSGRNPGTDGTSPTSGGMVPLSGCWYPRVLHRTLVTSDLAAVAESSDHGLGKGGASSFRGSPLTPVFSRF